MSNIVAIIGRPNVGKSTLFNRLTGERKAIVDNFSGVTRDRLYGNCDWGNKRFIVVDTGGFVSKTNDVFELEIRTQVKIALDEAQVILFVVDATTGITAEDEEIANLLRKSKKNVALIVNKVDNSEKLIDAAEFYKMGFKNVFMIASASGSGTGDMLDYVIEHLPESNWNDEELPKFAIIGQPNVGKSSLLNVLTGENRNIVTPIAGTTRDSIHTKYEKFDKKFWLIDTAGIRRKDKVEEALEFYSVMRAIQAIESADVCFIMLDAQNGITHQDLAIFRLAESRKRGIVILVNKWDLIKKESNTHLEFEHYIKEKIKPFDDVPILFISTIDKTRIHKALEVGLEVYDRMKKRISTSTLNDVMLKEIENYTPPTVRGKIIKIKYITQLPTKTPAFAFFSNYPKDIRAPYKNFLENKLRKYFDFTGVPISIYFRDK